MFLFIILWYELNLQYTEVNSLITQFLSERTFFIAFYFEILK